MIGASADQLADQEKFTTDHKLPYPLWSDPELKLIKALGVQMAGRNMAQRVTFVVDPDGKIAKVYEGVKDVRKHPKEVVAFTKEMTKKK